jgi:predicted LPLAT superfamily acyltransferase
MLAEMVEETEDYASVADRAVTDVAAVWLTPQYMLSLRHQLADQPEGPRRFRLLRLAVNDVVQLQRGGHSSARIQLDRERLELDRQKRQDALAAAEKKVQKLRDPKLPLSDEDRRAIVDKADEILGLK